MVEIAGAIRGGVEISSVTKETLRKTLAAYRHELITGYAPDGVESLSGGVFALRCVSGAGLQNCRLRCAQRYGPALGLHEVDC